MRIILGKGSYGTIEKMIQEIQANDPEMLEDDLPGYLTKLFTPAAETLIKEIRGPYVKEIDQLQGKLSKEISISRERAKSLRKTEAELKTETNENQKQLKKVLKLESELMAAEKELSETNGLLSVERDRNKQLDEMVSSHIKSNTEIAKKHNTEIAKRDRKIATLEKKNGKLLNENEHLNRELAKIHNSRKKK